MKRVVLTIAMLISPLCANADWVSIIKSTYSNEYFEESRVKKDGDIRSTPYIIDLGTPTIKGVSSVLFIKEVNCKTKQARSTYSLTYSGSMGSGNRITESFKPTEWESSKSGSYGEMAVMVICAKPM